RRLRLGGWDERIDAGRGEVPVWTSAISNSDRYSGENVLADVDLPATEDGVDHASMVQPALAPAKRQLVDEPSSERQLLVVGGSRLSRPCIVRERIVIAQRLRHIERGVQRESPGIALLDGKVAAMPRIVVKVREKVDGSELRVNEVILLGHEDLVLKGAIV